MKCSAERLIEALIAVEMLKMQKRQVHRQASSPLPAPFVVTVSRDYGSMGREVAQLLAATLEVRCCDRMILQEVARRAHVDETLVRALDEHVSHIGEHWWQRLMHDDALSYDEYYHHLVKTVLSISRTGGVIVGRGANYILGAERAFRVRITGSDKCCARRIAEREGLDHEKSLAQVREVNRERAEYIRILYKADIDDHRAYDLVLNSDQYERVQIVGLVLDAMEKAGYKLPRDCRRSLSLLA